MAEDPEATTGTPDHSRPTDWLEDYDGIVPRNVIDATRFYLQRWVQESPEEKMRKQGALAKALKGMGAQNRKLVFQVLKEGNDRDKSLQKILGRILSNEKSREIALPNLPEVAAIEQPNDPPPAASSSRTDTEGAPEKLPPTHTSPEAAARAYMERALSSFDAVLARIEPDQAAGALQDQEDSAVKSLLQLGQMIRELQWFFWRNDGSMCPLANEYTTAMDAAKPTAFVVEPGHPQAPHKGALVGISISQEHIGINVLRHELPDPWPVILFIQHLAMISTFQEDENLRKWAAQSVQQPHHSAAQIPSAYYEAMLHAEVVSTEILNRMTSGAFSTMVGHLPVNASGSDPMGMYRHLQQCMEDPEKIIQLAKICDATLGCPPPSSVGEAHFRLQTYVEGVHCETKMSIARALRQPCKMHQEDCYLTKANQAQAHIYKAAEFWMRRIEQRKSADAETEEVPTEGQLDDNTDSVEARVASLQRKLARRSEKCAPSMKELRALSLESLDEILTEAPNIQSDLQPRHVLEDGGKINRTIIRSIPWKILPARKKPSRLELRKDATQIRVMTPNHEEYTARMGCVRPSDCSGIFKSAAVTKEWAGIFYAQLTTELQDATSMFPMAQQALVQRHFPNFPMTEDFLQMGKNIVDNAHRIGILAGLGAIDVCAKGNYSTALNRALEEFSITVLEDLERVMQDSNLSSTLMRNLNRTVAQKASESIDEAYSRATMHLYGLALQLGRRKDPHFSGNASSWLHLADSKHSLETHLRNSIRAIATREMERLRAFEAVPSQELQDHLEIAFPSLLAREDLLPSIFFVHEQGRLHIACSREVWDQLPEPKPAENSGTVTEELGYYLSLGEAFEDYVTSTLPSIEELERQLFSGSEIEGRFLAVHEPGSGEPDEDIDQLTGVTPGTENGRETLPRLRTLRNLLLRNRTRAQFIKDSADPDSPREEDFSAVDRGHYIIVTLPDHGMQLAVSDDIGKGTYIIYNTIQPEEYTTIDIKLLRDNFGGTPVKWNSRAQWIRSIENTVRQQAADPKTIYPINANYPTPLDQFPSSESIGILRKDFQQAASMSGKAEHPWTLRVGDFQGIESGNQLWSFGGNACGHAYLDRLAREFGLSEKATEVPQHLFRRLILKTLLYETYEEYRQRQEQRDRQRSGTEEESESPELHVVTVNVLDSSS